MAKRDYYEILGVSKTASADEIRRAHRKLVRQYHPDVNQNNPKASEKFKEVQEAYDVLSDDTARKKYDQFGHEPDMAEQMRRAQQQQQQAYGSGGFGGFGGGYGPRTQTWQGSPGGPTVEDFDFGGAGGMGGIFEQLFGGGAAARRAGGRRARSEQRGSDIEHPLSITFEQAARGTSVNLQLNSGGDTETIEVKIPAGVKDGSRVRIKGKGGAGPDGNGDLFIITTITPHPYFKRDNLDVLLDFPISLYEAINGAKITAPTLDGPVTLTIPPGTSSHAKLRIAGRGIFRGSEKGDQFVILRVVIPKGLDADDKKAIDEIARKHPINARADVKW